jgi:hypothetical protein
METLVYFVNPIRRPHFPRKEGGPSSPDGPSSHEYSPSHGEEGGAGGGEGDISRQFVCVGTNGNSNISYSVFS